MERKKEQTSENERAIEPYIEIDGGFARCSKCWNEVVCRQEYCRCGQKQDWSWLKHS